MDPIQLADRIADYRARSGLTQQDLARQTGLERTALTKIENGQRRVSALELELIAAALGVRIEWFFQPPADALVAYRSALDPEAPTSAIDQLVERLSRDAAFVTRLLPERLATLAGEDRILATREEAETFAMEVRAWMRLAPTAPVTGIAESAARVGALIFSVDLGLNAPEAASLVGEGIGVAVVNGFLRVGRRRLAAAHELGHLLTRDGYRVDWRIDAPDSSEAESRLDQFARALLLPAAAVRSRWAASYDGGQREAAIRIASEYQVDMATLTRRLADLGLINSAQASAIRSIKTSKADIINLELVVRSDLEPPSAPRPYQQLVLRLYRDELITAGRAVDLLLDTLGEADLPVREPILEHEIWDLL